MGSVNASARRDAVGQRCGARRSLHHVRGRDEATNRRAPTGSTRLLPHNRRYALLHARIAGLGTAIGDANRKG